MISFDQWWLCYPPGSGAYPADCRHSWGSSGCTSGRTSTGTWAMWTWSLSAFLRGGQIHPVMDFVRERILILTHETNTHTHVPSTDKQTQSNTHRHTQIHTHRHTQTHTYSQTDTHKDKCVHTVFSYQSWLQLEKWLRMECESKENTNARFTGWFSNWLPPKLKVLVGKKQI